MCRVQSLATVEALNQVVRVPEVEIADLRALDAHNTEEVSRRHLEGLGVPRRYRELGNFGQLSGVPYCKMRRRTIAIADRIRQHRLCPAPQRRVRGWRRMYGLSHAFGSSESWQ